MRPGLVDSNSHKTRGNTLTCSSVFKKKEKKRALEKYSSSFIPCTVQSQEMHFSSVVFMQHHMITKLLQQKNGLLPAP